MEAPITWIGTSCRAHMHAATVICVMQQLNLSTSMFWRHTVSVALVTPWILYLGTIYNLLWAPGGRVGYINQIARPSFFMNFNGAFYFRCLLPSLISHSLMLVILLCSDALAHHPFSKKKGRIVGPPSYITKSKHTQTSRGENPSLSSSEPVWGTQINVRLGKVNDVMVSAMSGQWIGGFPPLSLQIKISLITRENKWPCCDLQGC